MTWRTILLTKDSKISLRMNHLVIASDSTTTIPITEIGQVIIENPNIVMTGHILNALSKHKVAIILCNEKQMPFSHVNMIYGHYRKPKIIKQQMDWSQERKSILWKKIVEHKINNQKMVLERYGILDQIDLFDEYISHVKPSDSTNREAHAAKVYFNQLFGLDFIRGVDNPINWALNYGYSLLLSLFTRAITTKGLLTEFGIHHSNQFNHYNLASDFMEVYRPLVDTIVKTHIKDEFGKYEKRLLIDMLNDKALIKNRKHYLPNSIDIYLDSMIHYLNKGDSKRLAFPTLLF